MIFGQDPIDWWYEAKVDTNAATEPLVAGAYFPRRSPVEKWSLLLAGWQGNRLRNGVDQAAGCTPTARIDELRRTSRELEDLI